MEASRYLCLSASSKYLHGSLAYSLSPLLLGRLLMRQLLEMRWLKAEPSRLQSLGKAYDHGWLLGGPEAVSVASPRQRAGRQASLTPC